MLSCLKSRQCSVTTFLNYFFFSLFQYARFHFSLPSYLFTAMRPLRFNITVFLSFNPRPFFFPYTIPEYFLRFRYSLLPIFSYSLFQLPQFLPHISSFYLLSPICLLNSYFYQSVHILSLFQHPQFRLHSVFIRSISLLTSYLYLSLTSRILSLRCLNFVFILHNSISYHLLVVFSFNFQTKRQCQWDARGHWE